MNVAVIGLGHVGCVSAACLARAGHRVVAVDASQTTVDLVSAGKAPVAEPGLDELIAAGIGKGALAVTTDVAGAVRASDLALICVEAGPDSQDLTSLEHAASCIGAALAGRTNPLTVVWRTTVLPGTTDRCLLPALRSAAPPNARIKVAINPDFLRQGSALHDYAHPPLVLVGCDDLGTAAVVRELYAEVSASFVETSMRTAELVKYSSVAFHGLKVCFANEIGTLCDALGADAGEVMRIVAMDRKLSLSDAHLKPGFAFGGTGLPKDVRALVRTARDCNVEVPLLSAIMPSNERQIRGAVDRVLSTGRQRVGVVGLAFKPALEDLRESPVVAMVQTLCEHGLDVKVLDRNVAFARCAGTLRVDLDAEFPCLAAAWCDDVETLLDHADVLVIGRATTEAARALGLVGPECVIVDLTRGAAYEMGFEERRTTRPLTGAIGFEMAW